MTHRPENLLTVWADALLDALARAGVRDVVVSPGSRSTPFLLAAARRDDLRLHPVLDERAASFFALGLARVTGRPPLLLCTSGTAPAHYYPAVIEASEASLPLVVLSADRPTELSGTGAPQTTDQRALYGVHARAFVDLGDADPSPRALRAMRSAAARAVQTALGPAPGPVQINARARKPLEPCAAESDEGHALAALAASLPPVHAARVTLESPGLAHVIEAVEASRRVAVVAGPLPLDAPCEAILALTRKLGASLWAEASSQLRFTERGDVRAGDAFDLWLRQPLACPPEVILELGATPTSAAYARWLDGAPAIRRFVLGGTRHRDPSGAAEAVLLGDLSALVTKLDAALMARAPDPAFVAAQERAERRVWDAVEGALTPESEGAVVRAVVRALPAGALLGLGNSLPIRHADRFVPGGGDLRVITQRGVNGIDGWIAGLAGSAQADGGPAACIVGDVTAAHDLSSLALLARLRTPAALVVIDNGGGRIFEQLPIAQDPGSYDPVSELFTTPPAVRFERAAEAYGVRYEAAEGAGPARDALLRALEHGGATLVHVRVPPHGASEIERALREALK